MYLFPHASDSPPNRGPFQTGCWLNTFISNCDIIPLVKEGGITNNVLGHEIYLPSTSALTALERLVNKDDTPCSCIHEQVIEEKILDSECHMTHIVL
jgi:hypothetical protein